MSPPTHHIHRPPPVVGRPRKRPLARKLLLYTYRLDVPPCLFTLSPSLVPVPLTLASPLVPHLMQPYLSICAFTVVCLACCSLLAPAAATSSSRRLDCNPITSEFDGSHQGEAHVGSRLVLAGWLAGYDCAFFLLPGPLPPAALVINKESMVIESSTRAFSFNLTTNHLDGSK